MPTARAPAGHLPSTTKADLKRARGTGAGMEFPTGILAIASGNLRSGQTHALLRLLRANEDTGMKKRDAASRDHFECGLWKRIKPPK